MLQAQGSLRGRKPERGRDRPLPSEVPPTDAPPPGETDREFRYSSLFSPVTHRHSTREVQELAVYARRIAPNGSITYHPFLEIRFKAGATVDTFYLIETEHIRLVVATFERNPVFNGLITRLDGAK